MLGDRYSRWPLLGAALSLAVAIVSSAAVVGQRARVIHVLSIFVGGFGSGAGVARSLDAMRARTKARFKASGRQ